MKGLCKTWYKWSYSLLLHPGSSFRACFLVYQSTILWYSKDLESRDIHTEQSSVIGLKSVLPSSLLYWLNMFEFWMNLLVADLMASWISQMNFSLNMRLIRISFVPIFNLFLILIILIWEWSSYSLGLFEYFENLSLLGSAFKTHCIAYFETH